MRHAFACGDSLDKPHDPQLCIAGGLIRRLPDHDCVYHIGAPGTAKAGQPVPYPEYNTDALAPGAGSLKLKMYQASAVFNTAQVFRLSRRQLVEYLSSRNDFECSHLCRYPVPIVYTTPDGVVRTTYIFVENKACFALNHLICEPAEINRSRIKCPGGDVCREVYQHFPPCIRVSMPAVDAVVV